MILRRALSSDVSALYALEQTLFSAENFPLSRGSFAYHVKNNLLYVAQLNTEIVGYVLVLIKRSKAKLYSLGVSTLYRGKKIAQKLINKAIEEVKMLHFSYLLLEVRVDNAAAISLYFKLGFYTRKRLEKFYLDGCDAYLMEYKLHERIQKR